MTFGFPRDTNTDLLGESHVLCFSQPPIASSSLDLVPFILCHLIPHFLPPELLRPQEVATIDRIGNMGCTKLIAQTTYTASSLMRTS